MQVFAVTLEIPGERTVVTGVFKNLELAKHDVFEQEHMYDDDETLIADQRDVTWQEDGDTEVAVSLDGGSTYVITPLDLEVGVQDVVSAKMAEARS